MTGVEAVVGDHRLADGDLGTQHAVQRTLEPVEVETVGGGGERDHLAPGVNTGVGSPGAAELDGVAQHPHQGVGQLPSDRP